MKGTIELRNDVKKLMTKRRGYRRYKRNEKRHRKQRFNNRIKNKRNGWVAPSVKKETKEPKLNSERRETGMFIEMSVRRNDADIEAVTEICEFKGIRYNGNYGFASIKTVHTRHDYIIRMPREAYAELEIKLKEAIIEKRSLVTLEGDVYRVNKDNYALSRSNKESKWSLK
jgi:hypothetical protein